MSFTDYVQSFWGPSAPSPASPSKAPASTGGFFSNPFAATPSSGSSSSAQQLGSGVWPLSPQVREEMKKGTRFNMKVVLRGTKGTGKSTLLARLTGHPLPSSYTPSTELMASTMRLQGEYTAPHEGVKVDIWEAVEEGRQRSASSSSPNTTAKMARHIPSAQLQEALRVAADARLLDVYAGAHLAIFLIDPRQRASWEYAKQESLLVPPTCCVLYALNFSDAVAASPVVTLEELLAWTARARRATTSLVHRMLEGRQAAVEFSVRPMTAVLSALTGGGVMGVIRALHVASTLLRISTEEVRALRLFDLMTRQQAVSVGEEAASQPPHTTPPPAAKGETVGALGREPGLTQQTQGGTSELVAQSAPPQQHQQQQQQQPDTAVPAALRMEHRATTSSTVPRDSLVLATHHAGPSSSRVLSEAEAMKLFLGSGGSSRGTSQRSSSSSSSSSSTASAAGLPRGTREAQRTRGAFHTRHAPPSKTTTGSRAPLPSPSHEEALRCTQEDAAAAFPEPEAAINAGETVVHNARPVVAVEEVVRVLASTMVHDAAAPADDFFQDGDRGEGMEDAPLEGEGTVELPSASSAAAGVPKAARPATEVKAKHAEVAPSEEDAPPPERADGVMRARPLWTQRVARTAAAPAARSDHGSATPALQVEVSAILAQMTAALSASTPPGGGNAGSPSDGAAAESAAAQGSRPSEEMASDAPTKKKKKSSKPHRRSKDSVSEGHGHSRHRKHRGQHREAANDQPAEGQAEVVDDDGSFELVTI